MFFAARGAKEDFWDAVLIVYACASVVVVFFVFCFWVILSGLAHDCSNTFSNGKLENISIE